MFYIVFLGCYSLIVSCYQWFYRIEKQSRKASRFESIMYKAIASFGVVALLLLSKSTWGWEYGVPILLGLIMLTGAICVYFVERFPQWVEASAFPSLFILFLSMLYVSATEQVTI